MVSRRTLLATAAALAAPAIVPRASLGMALRTVRVAAALAATANAAYLLPKYLKDDGIAIEVIAYPSSLQRMEAVAAEDADFGYGGLPAAMQANAKGFPLTVLANGCDGGWMLLARPGITRLQDLGGKKVAVQGGSAGQVSLLWKLRYERLQQAAELVLLNYANQSDALVRGDVQAICVAEPYATQVEQRGWGSKLWVPYDTPMGRTNLGLVASRRFVTKEPELTRSIVQAHVKATMEMAADPAIASRAMIEHDKVSPEVAAAAVRNLFFSARSGKPFQDSIKALASMMVRANLLDRTPVWDRFVDTSLLT